MSPGMSEKDWSVGIYSALKLVGGASLPITINWASTTRVCTFLPPEFQDLKNTDIELKMRITRPGDKNPDIVICLAGTLRLNEKI
ncbi:hypothetical protein BGX24_002367 [Mortierella sp. AD032]|nr:hypothetical protein BGX24_002367 [Mortierella sp. AD032]